MLLCEKNGVGIPHILCLILCFRPVELEAGHHGGQSRQDSRQDQQLSEIWGNRFQMVSKKTNLWGFLMFSHDFLRISFATSVRLPIFRFCVISIRMLRWWRHWSQHFFVFFPCFPSLSNQGKTKSQTKAKQLAPGWSWPLSEIFPDIYLTPNLTPILSNFCNLVTIHSNPPRSACLARLGPIRNFTVERHVAYIVCRHLKVDRAQTKFKFGPHKPSLKTFEDQFN